MLHSHYQVLQEEKSTLDGGKEDLSHLLKAVILLENSSVSVVYNYKNSSCIEMEEERPKSSSGGLEPR